MRWLLVVVALGACGSDPPERCTDGERRECYTGPPSTEGTGACKPGFETCIDGEFTGICIGDVTPFVEHCDGVDEDCDGEIDNVSGSGEACTEDGCDGTTACVGVALGCIAPGRNECDVCGGTTVPDVGATCSGTDGCSGALVCNGAGDGTACDAPTKNECALCGGPAIVGLDTDCTNASDDCAGLNVCNGNGNDVECSCNPVPGMCRENNVFRAVVSPTAGQLVITEVMQNPSGIDSDREWFEVEVKADVDLNQLELDRIGDSLNADVLQSVDCIRVTAGTRLVFAHKRDAADNGGLPTVTGLFSFALVSAGNIELRVGATTIDAVSWTSETGGASIQLDPDFSTAAGNDDEAHFCLSTTAYNGTDLGTPGAPNAECIFPGECRDTDNSIRPVVPPGINLVISELLANPAAPPPPDTTTGDADKEWFEIVNAGTSSFDLNGLTFKSPSSAGITFTQTSCVSVPAGAFRVFARNATTAENGGLPQVDFTINFALVDTNSSGNASIQVFDGATLVDSVTWTSVTSGRALGLDPDHFNQTDNDLAAPTAGTNCLATATYGDGTNQGTPGTANPQCP